MGSGRSGGDGSETGSVTHTNNRDQYQCQPHPGLQGQRGKRQHIISSVFRGIGSVYVIFRSQVSSSSKVLL